MSPEELVDAFVAQQPYALDDFQLEAIRALANHHSVLVAAPTGTGKTVTIQAMCERFSEIGTPVFVVAA